MPTYLPICLNLKDRQCLVVGGGAVAVRRIRTLLEAGGRVTVVAPTVEAEIEVWVDAGRLQWLQDSYRASYIEGAFLVVAATDRPEVNAQVSADASACGILCNDTETPERGDFVIPTSVRRGDLLLAVTTGGASPSLSARIREELETHYGEEYAEYVALLQEIRSHVMATVPEPARRRKLLAAVAADKTLLPLVRAGHAQEAREKAYTCISSLSA